MKIKIDGTVGVVVILDEELDGTELESRECVAVGDDNTTVDGLKGTWEKVCEEGCHVASTGGINLIMKSLVSTDAMGKDRRQANELRRVS